VPPARHALARYLDLLADWSGRVNLTGARSPAERVDVLVAAALRAVPLLGPGSLLDIGSGNGSPGLVLALLEPERAVTLLEPRSRRWAFLREAARAVGRRDVRVLRERHDEYDGAPAGNVTLRALRLPLAEVGALVEKGGRVLTFGPRPAPSAGWRELPAAAPGPTAFVRAGAEDVPRGTE
jgi:16S rRNA (guanine527-N7)-methyltransferase